MSWESFICSTIGEACHVSLIPYFTALIIGLGVTVIVCRILLLEDPEETPPIT